MIYKLILVALLATSVAFGSSIKGAARDELAIKGDHRQLSSPVEYQRRQELSKSSTVTRDELQQEQQQQQQQREVSKTAPPVRQEQQREAPLSKTQERDEQRRVEPSKTSAHATDTTEQRREEQQLVQYQEQQKVEEIQQQQQQQQQQVREEAPLLTQQKEEVAAAPAPTKTLRYEAKTQIAEEALAGPAKGQKVEFQKVEAQREEGLKASKLAEQVKQQQEQKTIEEPKATVYEQQRETYYDQQQQQQQQQQLTQQVELRDYEQQQQQQRIEDQQFQYQQQQEEQRAISGGGVKGAAPEAPKAAAASQQGAEPEPYSFDYSVEGSSRRETGDANGVVRGQYTVQNPDGSSRIVDYIADRDGFRASVNTNEFGTESGSPANVELRSSQPAAQDISLRLEGKTREFLNKPQDAIKGQAAPAALAPPAKPDNWNVKGQQQQPQQQQQITYIEEIRNTKTAAPASTPVQQQQQQEFVYVDEVRATKGAAPAAPAEAKVTVIEQAPLVQRAPAKGQQQRLETIESQQEHQQLALSYESPKEALKEAPAKVELVKSAAAAAAAAEYRTPKAIGADQLIKPTASASTRLKSGFESATAHRPIVAAAPRIKPIVHYHHQLPAARQHFVSPATITRNNYNQHQHHQQQQAVRGVQYQHQRPPVASVASVLRSQLQHDRYPPNPAYSGYYSSSNSNNNRNERPLNPRVSFYSNNAESSEDTPIGFGDAS